MPAVAEALRRTMQPLVSSHRLVLYTVLSLAALLAVTVNALRSHSNFYSVTVYLARSSRSVIILANFGFLTALVCGRIMQKVFFGPLLPAEVERLYDRIWFFITESLLAFTVFRDELDVVFGLMFGFLLFVKCFHWLMADRIEWMDQRPYPGPPPLFHIRILCLFALLTLTDIAMFMFAVESSLTYGVGATVFFANEYAILTASAWNAMAKYGLSIYELRRASTRGGADAPPWEAKSGWVFYIELITDFFKLSTYLVFFTVITMHFGLPLNMIRDVYMTAHSFFSRLAAFHRYRNATRDMDQRYPNVTETELSGTDRTCIICREEMVLPGAEAGAPAPQSDGPNMTPKKLPCGHIFHFHCLRSWLERQQNCPTCRRSVMDANVPTGAPAQRGLGQQAPANGGLPLPPQRPAGQARPWGLFAQDQGLGQQPNQAIAGGIGGFARRFFGAAAQPPLVPGQFGNGPLAQQPGIAAPPLPGAAPIPNAGRNPGAGGHGGQRPPALVFEYNYVHDFGQGPRLMQPPMLQGFYREDGLWQGWPAPGRPGAGGQPGPSRTATGTTPNGSTSVPQAITGEAPPPTHQANGGAAAPAFRNPTPTPTSATDTQAATIAAPLSGPSPTPVSRPATPRDAAAIAAMKRSGLTKPGDVVTPQTPGASSVTSPPPPPNPSFISSGTSEPATPAASSPSVATAIATVPPNASNTTHGQTPTSQPRAAIGAPSNRVALPSVIPLYDFGRRVAGRQPPASSAQPSPAARAVHQLHQTLHQPREARTHRVQGQSTATSGQNASHAQHRPGYSRSHSSTGPMHRLPQQMSEEELGRMDRLTRDAIDERIRVLEGVNGAVYRCLEELLRLRSILPPIVGAVRAPAEPGLAAAPNVGIGAEADTTPASGVGENSRDLKGKGKEVLSEPSREPSASELVAEDSSSSQPVPSQAEGGGRIALGSDTVSSSPPLAATVSSSNVTAAEPLLGVAPAQALPLEASNVFDQIAAVTGILAELEPLTSEVDTAGQAGAAAEADPTPGSLPPPPELAVGLEPEALPVIDGVPLAVADGDAPAAAPTIFPEMGVVDGINGEAGNADDVGGRWETVDGEAQSSGSTEEQRSEAVI